jgi:hypothetical protein
MLREGDHLVKRSGRQLAFGKVAVALARLRSSAIAVSYSKIASS